MAEVNHLLPEQLLYLIIRFSNSLPDLPLTISTPSLTPTLTLKQLIRAQLSHSYSSNRLRLIYNGRSLQDTAPLSKSLNLPTPRSPLPVRDPSTKAKGKEPIRLPPPQKLYVHCSIGDELTRGQLDAEARQAKLADEALLNASGLALSTTPKPKSAAQSLHAATVENRALSLPSHSPFSGSREGNRTGIEVGEERREGAEQRTTETTPQGFDRLLTAGFTQQEIAQLRAQFLANVAYSHTPDTMPAGPALRRLEERWLESDPHDSGRTNVAAIRNNTGPGQLNGDGEVAEAGWGGGFGVEDEGGLDDLLKGVLVGFFWPLGVACWVIREEGVWSRRRQVAALTGVIMNLIMGFLRLTS